MFLLLYFFVYFNEQNNELLSNYTSWCIGGECLTGTGWSYQWLRNGRYIDICECLKSPKNVESNLNNCLLSLWWQLKNATLAIIFDVIGVNCPPPMMSCNAMMSFDKTPPDRNLMWRLLLLLLSLLSILSLLPLLLDSSKYFEQTWVNRSHRKPTTGLSDDKLISDLPNP